MLYATVLYCISIPLVRANTEATFSPSESVMTSSFFQGDNTVRGFSGDGRPVFRVSTDQPFASPGAETIYLTFGDVFSAFSQTVKAVLTVQSVAGGFNADASAANPFTVSAHAVNADPLTSIIDDTNPGGTITWLDFYSNNILAADSAAHTVVDGFGAYDFDVSAAVNGWITGANTHHALALTGKNDISGQDFLHGFSNNTELPGSIFLTISPVPEPEEWAMLLAGLGLLGYRLRRHPRGSRGSAGSAAVLSA
jgi:hypothetical protein